MTVVFRTDDAPAAERADYWRHVLADELGPIEPWADEPEVQRERLEIGDAGAVRVAELTTCGGGGAATRAPRLRSRAGQEMFKIDVMVQGHGVIEQGRRTSALRPGDLTLVDLGRPVRWRMSSVRCVAVVFPRVLLPFTPDALRDLSAVRIPGDEGPGVLVSTMASGLVRHLDGAAPLERARYGTALLDLLAVALASCLGRDADVPVETRQRALLRRILIFVEEQLGDPDLSPGTIAAAHHLSLRSLHKLFEGEQVTVAEWIRRRRLERCRRDLLDPALRSDPVSAIGARWGLTNPTHFSRVFRSAYGAAPLDYRTAGAGFSSTPSAASSRPRRATNSGSLRRRGGATATG